MSNIENDVGAMGDLNSYPSNNVIMLSSSSIEMDNEDGKYYFLY